PESPGRTPAAAAAPAAATPANASSSSGSGVRRSRRRRWSRRRWCASSRSERERERGSRLKAWEVPFAHSRLFIGLPAPQRDQSGQSTPRECSVLSLSTSLSSQISSSLACTERIYNFFSPLVPTPPLPINLLCCCFSSTELFGDFFFFFFWTYLFFVASVTLPEGLLQLRTNPSPHLSPPPRPGTTAHHPKSCG
ncbi:hypothetical protein ANANG_G00076190, partial [Anguilla anguilla]